MTRPAGTARHAVSAAAALTAAGLTLTGCKFSASNSDSGSARHSTGAASPGNSSPASTAGRSTTASPARSRPGNHEAGRPKREVITSFFPVHAGDTWVYQTHLEARRGTTTTRMTRVVRTARGRRVTMTVRNSVTRTGRAGKATTLTYVFRPDGSMIVPLRSLSVGTIRVESGSSVWPSPAALASGKSRESTVIFTADIGGRATTIRAQATVRDSGSQTVTVPAGTYLTQVIDEILKEKVNGIPVLMELRTWIANGVGPVRSELVTTSGFVASPGAIEELESFTKG